ncbi:MAG TPA: alpha/beta hydrolase [Pyrinomonadaceae bacterium]|nr:alpha/beta hydrolase [Pyrinomonadaceae bacterium]
MTTEHLTDSSLDRAVDELGCQVVGAKLPPLKQININGSELTYIEQGKGELVVFVHGALGDFRTWSRQLAQLAPKYHGISYSRRYHHRHSSTKPAIEYTHRHHVEDLIVLINALGRGPAHLVGHSYGATVAALVTLERPDLVKTLILGEPSLFSVLSGPHDKVSLRLYQVALDVVRRLFESGEERLAIPEYVNIALGKDVFHQLALEDLLVINQNAHTLGPMLRTYFEPTALDDTSAQKIKTPTLIITGEFSPGIYKAINHKLHNCLPNSETFILPGASHGLQMENPEDFRSAMFEFLSKNRMKLGDDSC